MYEENNYPNDYSNHSQNTQSTQGTQSTQNTQNTQNPYQAQGGYHSQPQSSYYNRTQDTYSGQSQGTYSGQAQNSYNGYSGYQSQSHTSTYQYGSTYPNDYTQSPKKNKKEKKPRIGKGYLRKAVLAISLGLFFGLFAGLGLYIVENATGMLDHNETTVAVADPVSEVTTETANAANADAQAVLSGSTATTDSSNSSTGTVTAVVSDVSEVVEQVMPSIVAINNHYTEKMSYFGQSIVSEEEASGSGIIVGQNDTELLIATNYHVIDGADTLTVQFYGNDSEDESDQPEASVKGTDSDMDLAVIAVSLDSLSSDTLSKISVATLGDSDSLVVGEPAIAIGNSLGYGQSVTLGVISALNRSIELSDGSSGTFIQTDAAINPGNSGGALLNVKGEVIGINSNKIGGTTVEGMGYAIPISAASPIIADLMLKETKNKVSEEERGYLGISGISVTEDVSEAYGMPQGVYIAQVYEGTAAEAAGLQKGDIITAFDGDTITSMDALQKELEFYAKGDTVEITVMTSGIGGYVEKTVSLTLGNKVQ